MSKVLVPSPVRPVTRLEEQDPDPVEALWQRAVRDVEDEGEALGVEAMMRANGDTAAAALWLLNAWRVWPDQRERAVRAEALELVALFRRVQARAMGAAA